MKKYFAHLTGYTRINSSSYGNPNYEVSLETETGEFEIRRSSSNSSWCYGISGDWVGKTVVYTLTRAGRIDTMKKAELNDVFVDKVLFPKEAKK